MAGRGGFQASVFATQVLIFIGMLLVVAGLFFLRQLVLMVFVSVLLALFWSAATDAACRRLPSAIPRNAILLPVVLGSLGVFVLLAVLLARPIREQFQELAGQLPELLGNIWQRIQPLADRLGIVGGDAGGGGLDISALATSGISIVQAGFRGILGFVTVLFLGIFFAMRPKLYRRGVIRLFPRDQRDRVDRLLEAWADTLRQWLKATGITIVFISITTTILLSIIGLPYSLLFGVAAGIFELVPFLGPMIAFTGPVLIALSISMPKTLWVIAAWSLVQFLEGNVITPAVMANKVQLPPALTLIAIFAMGELFGLIGVLLAAPTLAVILSLDRVLRDDFQ